MDKTPRHWIEGSLESRRKSTKEERHQAAQQLGGLGAYVQFIGNSKSTYKIHRILESGHVQLELVYAVRSTKKIYGTGKVIPALRNPFMLEKAESPPAEKT